MKEEREVEEEDENRGRRGWRRVRNGNYRKMRRSMEEEKKNSETTEFGGEIARLGGLGFGHSHQTKPRFYRFM